MDTLWCQVLSNPLPTLSDWAATGCNGPTKSRMGCGTDGLFRQELNNGTYGTFTAQNATAVTTRAYKNASFYVSVVPRPSCVSDFEVVEREAECDNIKE